MELSFEKIVEEIETSSKKILSSPNDFKRQLASAIYFVSNQKLNHWSISKEIACYKFNVSKVTDAKIFFYDNGFINGLETDDVQLKKAIITSFSSWATPFSSKVDVISKFRKDQAETNRIQLLVPSQIIEKKLLAKNKTSSDTYTRKLEGQEMFLQEYKYNFRDKKLVEAAKDKWKTNCWVCGFNFTDKYGDLGKDFIEIHHLIAINEGERETDIDDVRPLCSNCHRMIHRRTKMLTIQQLKNIIEEVEKHKACT